MNNKLSSYSTVADALNFFNLYPSLDFGGFEVVDGLVSDEQVPFLFLFIVVELENGTAHVDCFQLIQCLPPFLNYFTIDFSEAHFSKSYF